MRLLRSLVRSLAVSLALAAARGAVAHAGVADKARVTFVSGGGLTDGAYQAAIVIDLAPDTTTYWRNPGEAGSPPVFDFSASANLASFEVAMPAPKRIEEAGLDVFGYRTRVAFAVTIRPRDASRVVAADLKMDYAACEKICIPMHAEAKVDLTPSAAPGADPATVEAAAKLLPRKTTPGEAAKLTTIAGSAKPAWRVEPKIAGASDLFPEAPDGFFFETVREGPGFLLTMVEKPAAAAPGPVPVRLTMPAPAGAVEFEVRLDATASKP